MVAQILVPVDDSEQSTKALEYALREYPDDQITALHVIALENIPQIGDESMFNRDEFVKDLKEQRERGDTEDEVLEQVRETAADYDNDINTVIGTGKPAPTIVEYIDTEDIDHVVMGSHGRTGTSRMLFGSVAENVTRRSPVPVTIIP